MSVRMGSRGGWIDEKGVRNGGLGIVYWICDTCGSELEWRKALEAGFRLLDYGDWNRQIACSTRCAAPLLEAKAAEFRTAAGVLP